jgi:hypothetical protein
MKLLSTVACMPDVLHRMRCTDPCCSCQIPDPCWMPRKLGARCSTACPGASANILFEVENCGAARREYTIESSGDDDGIAIKPAKLSLGPLERELVSVQIDAPKAVFAHRDVLLWVRGCNDHALRWQVKASPLPFGSPCCRVEVKDCPDLIHHWYDHFYCDHPCFGT